MVIEDGVVPELMFPKGWAPHNEIKRFLPLFTSKTLVLTDHEHAQFMLTDDGFITPITKP